MLGCCNFTVNVGEDCPVFDGMYEFCQLSAGGSVGEPFFRCECYSYRVLLKQNYMYQRDGRVWFWWGYIVPTLEPPCSHVQDMFTEGL